MFTRRFVAKSLSVMTAAVLVLAPSVLSVASATETLEPEVHQGKFIIVPRAMGGWVLSRISSLEEDNMDDRVTYGFGLSIEYCLTSRLLLAGNIDVTYKKVLDETDGARAVGPSVAGLYVLRPLKPSSLFLRGEAGVSRIKVLGYDDGETHPHLRLGIGQLYFKNESTAWRFEFFYKRIFYESTYRGYTDGPVHYIGLEIGACLVL